MAENSSGQLSFSLKTEYRLFGNDLAKAENDYRLIPLYLYLHGYNQNTGLFEQYLPKTMALPGYHLLIEGPYPVPSQKRSIPEWGRAWYLYDGDQQRFRDSMETTCRFIDQSLQKLEIRKNYSIVPIGYSMGGYLAGYFWLTRPDKVMGLVSIASRIKSEWVTNAQSYRNKPVLVLHGSDDEVVSKDRAWASGEKLQQIGIPVTMKEWRGGHKFLAEYDQAICHWMTTNFE